MVDFSYESPLWENGLMVGGVDEVGRGALAGPVVSGCVVFRSGIIIPEHIKINDSKVLTSKMRMEASEWIKFNSVSWGIGGASAKTINKIGIVKATQVAMRRAVLIANQNLINQKLNIVEHLLLDAFYLPRAKSLPLSSQTAIVKGDGKSVSIAAASIIAKVYRDELMERLSGNKIYQNFGWETNKGYGTKFHQDAIAKHGASLHHRDLFLRRILVLALVFLIVV
jgi:ribonuclease HII